MYSLKRDHFGKIQLYFFSGNLFDPRGLVGDGASCEASSEFVFHFLCGNAFNGVLNDLYYGKELIKSRLLVYAITINDIVAVRNVGTTVRMVEERRRHIQVSWGIVLRPFQVCWGTESNAVDTLQSGPGAF